MGFGSDLKITFIYKLYTVLIFKYTHRQEGEPPLYIRKRKGWNYSEISPAEGGRLDFEIRFSIFSPECTCEDPLPPAPLGFAEWAFRCPGPHVSPETARRRGRGGAGRGGAGWFTRRSPTRVASQPRGVPGGAARVPVGSGRVPAGGAARPRAPPTGEGRGLRPT